MSNLANYASFIKDDDKGRRKNKNTNEDDERNFLLSLDFDLKSGSNIFKIAQNSRIFYSQKTWIYFWTEKLTSIVNKKNLETQEPDSETQKEESSEGDNNSDTETKIEESKISVHCKPFSIIISYSNLKKVMMKLTSIGKEEKVKSIYEHVNFEKINKLKANLFN